MPASCAPEGELNAAALEGGADEHGGTDHIEGGNEMAPSIQTMRRTQTTELEQFERDIQNFLFPSSDMASIASTATHMFPLREVLMCGAQGGLGFVNAPLMSAEI